MPLAISDSSAIDAALVAYLGSDAQLLALCPNGVYMDMAPAGSTRFVIVSLVDEHDEPMQGGGGRAIEDALYLVEVRMLSTAGGNIRAAAARIDALLEDHRLMAPGGGSPAAPIPGYAWMALHREGRLRLPERDEIDPTLLWLRRGGHYRLMMSVEPA